MVTVKSKTIKTDKFEHEVAQTIKLLKGLPRHDDKEGGLETGYVRLSDALDLVRALHRNCLEYVDERKNQDFQIFDALRM